MRTWRRSKCCSHPRSPFTSLCTSPDRSLPSHPAVSLSLSSSLPPTTHHYPLPPAPGSRHAVRRCMTRTLSHTLCSTAHVAPQRRSCVVATRYPFCTAAPTCMQGAVDVDAQSVVSPFFLCCMQLVGRGGLFGAGMYFSHRAMKAVSYSDGKRLLVNQVPTKQPHHSLPSSSSSDTDTSCATISLISGGHWTVQGPACQRRQPNSDQGAEGL